MGKIPDYTALTAPADDDQLLVVDVSDTTDGADGSSRSLTLSSLLTGGLDADLGAITADGLEIAPATNAIVKLENTSRSDADTRTAWLDNAGQSFYIRSIDSVDAVNQNFAVFNHSTGATNLTGSSSVTVPAVADGDTEAAAQVTARDSGTGQLAIAGIELGDTGWRDISSLLANGWTATTFNVRRVGYVSYFEVVGLDASAATGSIFLASLAGFMPGSDATSKYYDTLEVREGTNLQMSVWEVYRNTTGMRTSASVTAIAAAGQLAGTLGGPVTTAWPSTLPGTAA